jgi:hypothetical protein
MGQRRWQMLQCGPTSTLVIIAEYQNSAAPQ